MAPPRALRQEQPDGVCASHASFERMIERALAGLGDQITKLAEAVTAQSKANGDSLAKVLSNQADRRELCGQQNARIDNLEKRADTRDKASDDQHADLWDAVNKLRTADVDHTNIINRGIGACMILQIVVTALITLGARLIGG